MDIPYPPVGFHFKVEFGLGGLSTNDSRFAEVSGLTAEMGVEELVEGGENRFAHRLPVRAKYSNLTLKRGLLSDSKLVPWIRDAIENFTVEPTTVLVTLLNERGMHTLSWNFVGAYPVKWVVSDFKSTENGIVTESLELVYQYFNRK